MIVLTAKQHKCLTCWKPHWWVGRKLGQEVWGSQRWSTRAGRSPPKSRWLSEQKAAHIYYLVLNHPLTFFVAKEKPPDKFFRLGRSATRAIALRPPKFASSLFLFSESSMVRHLMENSILNFHFVFRNPSLSTIACMMLFVKKNICLHILIGRLFFLFSFFQFAFRLNILR